MLNRDNFSRLENPVINLEQASKNTDPINVSVDGSGFGFSVTDETGQIILWNQALTRLTGLTSKKVLGTRIWDVPFSLLPAELQTLDALERIRAPFLSLLNAASPSGQVQKLDIEFHLSDGARLAMVGNIQAIATDRGNYLLYSYQQADKNLPAEDLPASGNDKFRNVVEQAHDGIVIFNDKETILEWNDGWELLVGIKREEAIGQNFSEIMPELFQGPEWQSAELETSLHSQVVRQLNHIANSGLPHITEGSVQHKDGARKWVQAITFPIHARNAQLFATTARDISSLKQNEERLKRYVRQLDTLRVAGLEISAELGMDSLIWMIAPRVVELLNGTGMALYLHNPEKDLLELAICLGDNLPDLEKKARRGEALAGLVWESNKAILLENYHTGRTKALTHSYWGKVAGTPIIYGNEFMGVIFVFSDEKFFEGDVKILELFGTHAAAAIRNARLHLQISQLAITDSLTGIYNRRHFFEMAEKEFHQAIRYKRAFSIIIFDLDLFKKVNDTYGHSQGDQVLAAVVQRCAGIMRGADILGRYGGEEFIIALPETGETDALALAERLRQELASKPVETNSHSVLVTASFGVASMNTGITDLLQIINRADVALYQVKHTGRNQVQKWTPLFEDEIPTPGQE